jgi:hypothetical protein
VAWDIRGRAIRHMAGVGWQLWTNWHMTRGMFVANGMVTRGPINGRHVSPGNGLKFM